MSEEIKNVYEFVKDLIPTFVWNIRSTLIPSNNEVTLHFVVQIKYTDAYIDVVDWSEEKSKNIILSHADYDDDENISKKFLTEFEHIIMKIEDYEVSHNVTVKDVTVVKMILSYKPYDDI